MTSLVSLAAAIWVETATKQTMKAKDNKGKRLFLKHHAAEIISCGLRP